MGAEVVRAGAVVVCGAVIVRAGAAVVCGAVVACDAVAGCPAAAPCDSAPNGLLTPPFAGCPPLFLAYDVLSALAASAWCC